MFKSLKKKESSVSSVDFAIMKDLMQMSYGEDSLELACGEILKLIIQHYDFEFVTILLYQDNIFNIVTSNVHTKFHRELTEYVQELQSSFDSPYLEEAAGGFMTYPTADLRDITGMYYHPLYIHGVFYGALLLEVVDKEPLSLVDSDMFRLIMDNLAFTIRNIEFTQQIKDLSERDSLTGTFNKRYMFTQLSRACDVCRQEKGTFCLGIFDIDHFKTFNDTYGHQHGDLVLKKVAACIQSTVTSNDRVYRFGGEEFVIYFKDKVMAEAEAIMNQIRINISELEIIMPDTKESTPVKVSGGLAQFPLNATNFDELFRAADDALYMAKDNGRNNVVISTIMR